MVSPGPWASCPVVLISSTIPPAIQATGHVNDQIPANPGRQFISVLDERRDADEDDEQRPGLAPRPAHDLADEEDDAEADEPGRAGDGAAPGAVMPTSLRSPESRVKPTDEQDDAEADEDQRPEPGRSRTRAATPGGRTRRR